MELSISSRRVLFVHNAKKRWICLTQSATTSVHFVCDGLRPAVGDRGFTSPGESIYI
ncbi:MAG: hypothetical protein V7K18_04410 [Nostoc sp.]|uniref:hypothetical protein n=1 Tax=Nostoc sp. TaxID=1180 RepID=UPI002FF962BF